MKMLNHNKRLLKCLAIFIALFAFNIKTAKSQFFEVKDWNGLYPEMNNSYPLIFMTRPGPTFFLRTWPTHYYIRLGAMPVYDALTYVGENKDGLLRIAARVLEKQQMKGRHSRTEGIKENSKLQKEIAKKLFDARSDHMDDIYLLGSRFLKLYQKIDDVGLLYNGSKVKQILQKEADDLMLQFLMVNLFKSSHGEKIDVFTRLDTDLDKLIGEVDYTYNKLHFFNNFTEEPLSYSVLTH